ncbi:MAG: hypothetical protein RBR82_17690 [Pseudomonas sp.]|nr:hypothetical protein [Pseudomonas sp.]
MRICRGKAKTLVVSYAYSAETFEELLQASKRDTDVSTALDAIFLQIDDEGFVSARIAIAVLKERLTWDYRLS